MTESSKQRMEAVSKYFKEPSRDIYESGYKEGMQDPDANKKPYNVIYGDEESLYRSWEGLLEMVDNRFKKIEELQEKYNQAMKDWSADAIKKTEVIVKLEAENKKLREALWDLRNGMVNVHNLLLDYYSEGREYWETPNIAFKKSKEALEKLKESKALSSGGE